jgi:hypothetical protein
MNIPRIMFCDNFALAAGFCQAALQALKKPIKEVHGRVLSVLNMFFGRLRPASASLQEALAELVAGDLVEATVRHISEAGQDMQECGVTLLLRFAHDLQAVKRLSAPGIVDLLLKWAAKWLLKVRHTGS